MMLDEDPSCTILIVGRYMPPVRAEYNKVRHLTRKARLRPTLATNGHLRSVTAQHGRLEAFAPIGLARGRRVRAVLHVGERDDRIETVLDAFRASGAIVYTSLGV
jgi:hypothetical protein